MILPERMAKMRVVGPKDMMERIIREMHAMKVMHIRDHKSGGMDIGTPLEQAEKYARALVTVRALIAALGISEKRELSNGFRAVGVKNFRELIAGIENARAAVQEQQAGLQALKEERKEMQQKASVLAELSGIDVPLAALGGYRHMACFVGYVKETKRLHDDIAALTDAFELKGNGTAVMLAIKTEYAEKAKETLEKHRFSELNTESIRGLKGTPIAELERVGEHLARADRKKVQAEESLLRARRKWNDFLVLSEQFLQREVEKAESPLRFGTTRNVFMVKGWVPEQQAAYVRERLMRVAKSKLDVFIEAPSPEDDVPVKLNNPSPVRQFEFFLRLFSLPKYQEIDPSIMFALTFPVFFGFILGDMGYGIVTFSLFWLLKKKLPAAAGVLDIMMLASLSSFIFGALFGEVFGYEVVFGRELPHILSRLHQITELMMLAIGIGALHVNLGLVLGFFNELRHGFWTAFFEKASWMVVQAGVALIGAGMQGYLAVSPYVGYAILATGIVMVYKGESIRGLIELPAIFSNILSYSRLMAVGLASVGLAVVVNDFATGLFAQGGIVAIAGGVLILVIGHSINMALGILGGFLHSLRLHYVEFFTKFFKGGAMPYEPFGSSKM